MQRKSRQIGDSRERNRVGTDLLRLYLQDIGRVDLLTNEEEVLLARQVQRRESLLLEQKLLSENYPDIKEVQLLCPSGCMRCTGKGFATCQSIY